MTRLRLQVSFASLQRKCGRKDAFRPLSSIADILKREYSEPCDEVQATCLPLQPSSQQKRQLLSPIPEKRKAFVEETMVAVNAIAQDADDFVAVDSVSENVRSTSDGHASENDSRSGYGTFRLLLDVFHMRSWILRDTEMRRLNIVLRPTQMAWVLKVQKEPLKAWDFFNWATRRSGYTHDQHCFSVMIDLLGKAAEYSLLDNLLTEMERLKVPQNASTLSRLIEIYAVKGDTGKAEGFFDEMKVQKMQPNSFIMKCMLEVFAKSEQCEKALEVFEMMQQKQHCLGVVSYNYLLDSLSRNGMVEQAWHVYQDMKRCGNIPDLRTYGTMLRTLGHSGRVARAMEVWAELVRCGLKPNKDTYNHMLGALASENNVEVGLSLFKRMAEEGVNPDLQSCEATLKLLCKASQAGRTLELARAIEEKSAKVEVFESFIKGLGKMGYLQEVLDLVQGLMSDDINPSQAVYVGMIDALCMAGEPEKALEMLTEMEKHLGSAPLGSYSSVVMALCRCKRFEHAYEVLKQIHRRGLYPGSEMHNPVIMGLCEEGKLLLAEDLTISGCGVNVLSFNALLKAYAVAGDLERARKLLKAMEASSVEPNVDTYNAVIECFGQAGKSNVAVQAFGEMRKKGCTPNVVTYNSLLLALSKGGSMDAVMSLVKLMKKEGIVPNASTYAIIGHNHKACLMLR